MVDGGDTSGMKPAAVHDGVMTHGDKAATGIAHDPRGAAARWIGLAAVAALTFALTRIAVLNVFYTSGDMHDPGWFASVIWHNDWRLHGPPAFPGPFFSEHLVPLMWLANGLSFVPPLPKFDFYAACVAAIHALYAAGVYRAWLLSDHRVTAARASVAVLVGLAAAFSGVGIAALVLPHTEMAIPAFGLWFVIAMAERTYARAACWFAACLMVREDAGLHLFMLLTLWAGVMGIRQRRLEPDIRWLLGFAFVALGYSAAAFLAKRLYFPAGDILFRSYLGDPPLRHVTMAFVRDRLRFYLLERSYLTLPFALTMFWAVLARVPLLAVGAVATLPWVSLSLIAVHPTPGTISYYYGFPFWLSLAWPLVALRVWRDSGGPASGRPVRAAGVHGGWASGRWPYGLLLVASLVGWQGRLVVWPLKTDALGQSIFAHGETLRDRGRYQRFVDYFLARRSLFGVTAFDQAVFGLLMDHAGRETWLETWRGKPPDTLIYYFGSFEFPSRVVPLLRSGVYDCVYALPGTRLRMATKFPLDPRAVEGTPFVVETSAPGVRCLPGAVNE